MVLRNNEGEINHRPETGFEGCIILQLIDWISGSQLTALLGSTLLMKCDFISVKLCSLWHFINFVKEIRTTCFGHRLLIMCLKIKFNKVSLQREPF